MSAVLADFGLVWRHSVAPSRPRKVIAAVCAALAIGAGMFVYRNSGGHLMPRDTLLVSLPWLFLGMLYWLDLVSGAVRQDTPANARLAPRLRMRAMQLVGSCWLVFVLLITLALGSAFGNPALWAAAAAGWLLGSAMVRIGFQSGIAFMSLPFLLMLLPHEAIPTVRSFAGTAAGITACALWIGLVVWFGARTLFPRGDRHFDQRVVVEKGVRQSQGNHTASMRSSLYATDLARVSHTRTSAGELVLHALGPGAHWSVSARMFVVLAAVLVAGRVLIEVMAADTRTLAPFVGGFIIMPLLLSFAAIPQRIVGRASASQGEQTLLRLAPVVPRMDQYNRALASALLRRALGEWAIVTAALVAVTGAVDAHPSIWLLQFAACCLAMPLMTMVLRDYARAPALSMAYMYLAALYLVLSAGAAYYAMLRLTIVPVAVVSFILGVGATAYLAASRRRAMVGAPVAFPAGRLAA